MGGVTMDGSLGKASTGLDVISAAKAWADAKEALIAAKVKRSDAPLCKGKYPYDGHPVSCRIMGRYPRKGAPSWCADCVAWNDAQLNVEKAQRQLKKAEKALTAAIKAWRQA